MKWIESISSISFPGLGFEINPPEGVGIGAFSIQFYGVIIAVGLLLACWYGLRRGKEFGLTQDDILDGALMIIPFAIICARAYYCIFAWDEFKANPIEVLYIWQGGIAIYGGVIGAALGIVAYCLVKKMPIGTALDITALGFLIGQSIGRWGNFFNREAFGAETGNFLRMGLYLTGDRIRTTQIHFYHPTFLYESLWNAVGFALLHFISKRRKYDGQVALGYVAWYGLGRTFIEGLRTDSLYWGPFRVSQMLAALSCFAAVTVLVIMAFREHKPENLYVNKVAALEAAKAEEDVETGVPDGPSEETDVETVEEIVEEESAEKTETTEE